jgi:hypothetical protein
VLTEDIRIKMIKSELKRKIQDIYEIPHYLRIEMEQDA